MLRKPLGSKRQNRQRISNTTSVPAPTGGWNARDPIAEMKETDALILDNFWPTTSDVQIRLGHDNHATSVPGQVESLMTYVNASGSEKLFAAVSNSIFNVSSSGAVGAADVSGVSSGRWQHVNFRTVSGATSYMWIVNGVDHGRVYDNTNWISVSNASSIAVSNVATSMFAHVTHWKRRLWFTLKDSTSAAYLPVDSVGGSAATFDFGPLFKQGGHLLGLSPWTLDAGEGMDDHLLAISSKGEVAVYKGTDPASASTFALIGTFHVGQPIGRRCFLQYGGDTALITRDGVLPLSKALLTAQLRSDLALSDKIRDAFVTASSNYASNFGWQGLFFPEETMLLFNIPISEGSGQHQYVMNTVTNSWARFKGLSANCWTMFNNLPYFGGNTVVGKFWFGNDDNDSNIDAVAKQAFSYFKQKGVLKHFKEARAMFVSDNAFPLGIGLNVDYEDENVFNTINVMPVAAATWDSSKWDQAFWTGDFVIKDWRHISGIGFCAAIRLRINSQDSNVRWSATDFIYEIGGVI